VTTTKLSFPSYAKIKTQREQNDQRIFSTS